MAADVSALVRVLNGYSKEDQHRAVGNDSSCEKSTALITRDLLGGSSSSPTSKLVESQELDLDLQVPNGWEKRLDLKVRPFSHLGLFLSGKILLFPSTFFFFFFLNSRFFFMKITAAMCFLWNIFVWFGSLLVLELQFWVFPFFLCKEDIWFLFIIFPLLYVWSPRNWRNRSKRKFIFFSHCCKSYGELKSFSSWTSVELVVFHTPQKWRYFSNCFFFFFSVCSQTEPRNFKPIFMFDHIITCLVSWTLLLLYLNKYKDFSNHSN